MQTILESLRQYLGDPNFYINNGSYNYTWDYGAMLEYMVGAVLLIVVVSNVFKIIRRMFE